MLSKKLSLRDQLIGQQVLVNDQNGDAYQGVLVAYDATMARLESPGSAAVRFIDGGSKTVVDIGRWVNIPAIEIKFVVEAS